MPSANGRSRIDCDFVAHADEGGAIVCGMKVQGDFSPRGLRNYGSGQVNDFQVTLPQVLVNPQSLGLLRERLVEWQVNPSSFSLELGVSSGSDQRLTFAIGQDDKLIYSVAKPACILTYTGDQRRQQVVRADDSSLSIDRLVHPRIVVADDPYLCIVCRLLPVRSSIDIAEQTGLIDLEELPVHHGHR
ncbi:unnamed protein product, partial [Brugia timori]|uniref:TerD domain-containing protein n=1 Tax=Brugia timori TaxID=42155 RepID=A0A0R3RC01_9BILA